MKKEKKQEKVTEAPVPMTEVPVRTEASIIWGAIKDKPIAMFALPNQTVADFCKYQEVEPSKCYLLLKIGAVLPSLEEALGKSYKVELVDKWAVVSRLAK